MPGKIFVDSNVLVYARDATEREKQPKAMEWMAYLWQTRLGGLSIQVLQEFYVTVTQKLKPGMERPAARADVRNLLAWRPLPMGRELLEAAWKLEDRYQLSWWDSLIVSAAQATACQYLLTEDLQDGQTFANVRVLNPFIHTPREIH